MFVGGGYVDFVVADLELEFGGEVALGVESGGLVVDGYGDDAGFVDSLATKDVVVLD